MFSSSVYTPRLLHDLKEGKYVKLHEFIHLVQADLKEKLQQAGFRFFSKATYQIRTDPSGETFLREVYMQRVKEIYEVKLTCNEIQDLSRAYDIFLANFRQQSSTSQANLSIMQQMATAAAQAAAPNGSIPSDSTTSSASSSSSEHITHSQEESDREELRRRNVR